MNGEKSVTKLSEDLVQANHTLQRLLNLDKNSILILSLKEQTELLSNLSTLNSSLKAKVEIQDQQIIEKTQQLNQQMAELQDKYGVSSVEDLSKLRDTQQKDLLSFIQQIKPEVQSVNPLVNPVQEVSL